MTLRNVSLLLTSLLLTSLNNVIAQEWMDVRVLSKHHPKTVTIETRTRVFEFDSGSGMPFEYRAPIDEPISVTVNDQTTRVYRGALTLSWQDDEYVIINSTPLDMYVAGVVIGEIGAQAPNELLRAQAIIARTYAVRVSQRATLSDLAYHQVFKGFDGYAEQAYPIVAATSGQVLMSGHRVADLLFHAECGSMVYSPGEFWTSDQYFTPIALPNEVNKGAIWQVELTSSQLQQVFPQIRSLSRHSTRPVQIELTLASQTKRYEAENFRLAINRVHGWNTLPSNEYSVKKQADVWVFTGRGRGHLVGLCQQQAKELSTRGWTSATLLRYFYPDFSIGQLK
jgi:stage II sporulation protein D